tara:strand:+ start:140 stop:424 length:285 start_codon:yes stop_codon:yes gene_type:complete
MTEKEEDKKEDKKEDTKEETPQPIKKKKKKNRCSFCNKKYGMISFTCECNGTFCVACRSAHTHNCPVDRQKITKMMIEKRNPKIDHVKMVDVLG